jgi:hypothetical protein
MRQRSATATDHETHAVRIAWWASFLVTVALVAILGLAKSAQALTVPAAGGDVTAIAAAPPPSDEEPEDEAEASEDEEFEAGECEDDEEEECEAEEDSAEAPQECLLSTADATVFASHDRVRLLVRYTTSSPTAVAVDYGLHGGKGSLLLGSDRKHFAAQGVLHLTKRLSDSQMTKVMAAKNFTVRLRVLSAPGYCDSFFDRQLDVRRATPGGLTWSQSE